MPEDGGGRLTVPLTTQSSSGSPVLLRRLKEQRWLPGSCYVTTDGTGMRHGLLLAIFLLSWVIVAVIVVLVLVLAVDHSWLTRLR